jgi:hypothetical protein
MPALWAVILVEETRVPEENHRPAAIYLVVIQINMTKKNKVNVYRQISVVFG